MITHVFIIDHNLRAGSAVEVSQAAKLARSLGYIVATDRWDHNGITSGIQVKAREYRYTALGQLCRDASLAHLLTAHTADDQAETLLMRLDRQTGWRGLAGMPARAYAPLWPALAGVTLHRPWLGVSRSSLRDYNHIEDVTFIDDPSNENRDFTRVRARQALSADRRLRIDLLEQQCAARVRLNAERGVHAEWLSKYARVSPHGFIETDAVPPKELLLHCLNSVAGKGGPIDAAKRGYLAAQMDRSTFKSATLAGAWVTKTSQTFVFARDMVAVTGRKGQSGLTREDIPQGRNRLWDGRFWIRAKGESMSVEPAFGHLQNIRQAHDLKHIFNLPKVVRSSLPLYNRADDVLGFGAMDGKYIQAEATTASRLHDLYPGAIRVPV